MAWHAAKQALPLIAASSDVRVLLTGGIYDNKGSAAELRLPATSVLKNQGQITEGFYFACTSQNQKMNPRIHSLKSSVETRVSLY